MNEPFWLGILFGAVFTALVTTRIAAARRNRRALSRVEAKLDALLKHDGIRLDPHAGLPPRVRDALQSGKKIEAIYEYRLATGAGLKEAKEHVEEIQRRASAGG